MRIDDYGTYSVVGNTVNYSCKGLIIRRDNGYIVEGGNVWERSFQPLVGPLSVIVKTSVQLREKGGGGGEGGKH